MYHKICVILFLFTSATVPFTWASDEPLSTLPLSIQDAVTITLTNNPSLAGITAEAEAMQAVPPQQGALPDPMFGLNALNLPTDTFDLDQEPMTQMQISVSQKFPWPGRLALQRDAASKDAAAAGRRVAEKRLQLTASARSAWWRLAYLDRSIEIIKQNQQLMRDFIDIAQTKYKVGKGLQQDVLLAQLELSNLLNRQLPLEAMRDATEAELNALMGEHVGTRIVVATESANTTLPNLPSATKLVELAITGRPALASERDQVEAARIRVDVAKKKSYPDFTLGAAYGFRDATNSMGKTLPDVVSFRVGFNVPLYSANKQKKEVERQSRKLSSRRYSYDDAVRETEAEITGHHARYEASQNQVMLYLSAIIPQAQQTMAAMMSGYQVNKVDFLNVINAELALYNAQISYWEALSKAKQSLAMLAAATGEESFYE